MPELPPKPTVSKCIGEGSVFLTTPPEHLIGLEATGQGTDRQADGQGDR